MNFNEQRQNMEDAFDLYLKECCGIQEGLKHYGDVSPINDRLNKTEEVESLFDLTTIIDFKDTIDYLKNNNLYESLKRVVKKESLEELSEEIEEPDEPEIIDYTVLLDHYYNFLIAYKFTQAWIQPAKLFEEESESLAKNTIVFGAPGTGKSHLIKEFRKELGADYTSITFHPDTDYAAFVGCYKPTKDEKKDDLTYEFVPQAFSKAYVNAWKEDKPYCLIIEEINRGNCAQIFGDLFQLLDREDGISEYDNDTDSDLEKYLCRELAESTHPDITDEIKKGKKMMLPKNLWILATMNTSDQSLYPMDSAFKRRWEWKYVPFEKDKQDNYILVDGVAYSWSAFLDAINAQIKEVTQSEDKQLGFWFVKSATRQISVNTFVNKVLFYLWNDIFKDRSENTPFTNCNLSFQSFFKNSKSLEYLNIKRFLEQ
jgi:MoxR-like ATPase